MADALLAQLSDPHMRVGLGDLDSGRAFEAAVACVAALDPQPDGALVSGDLAEHASPSEYERVRELLAPLDMPVWAIPGNHDDLETLRASFDVPASGASCGGLRLIGCDSTVPGEDGGSLGPERLALLASALSDDRDSPTIAAVHHPPFDIGLPAADAIGLRPADGAALGELLGRRPQVRCVVAGHVHRGAFGRVGPCPAMACPSSWRQGVLGLRPNAELALNDDPAAFALHVLMDGEIASHIVPVDPA